MSDLEKYMNEIRDQLGEDEPASGHLRRFSRKLKSRQQPVRRLNFRHALQIAASIAIILASGVVIIKSSKGGDKIAVTPERQEFQNARNYYVQQVDARYNDIAGLSFDSREEKQLLLEELSEMDTYDKDLLKELDANPGDERVMNALIQHYQMKLQVMDQIINQLMDLKNSNTTENEKSTI